MNNLSFNLYGFYKFVFFIFLFEMILKENSLLPTPFINIIFYLTTFLMSICCLLCFKKANVLPFPIIFFISVIWVYFLVLDLYSIESFLFLMAKTIILIFFSFFIFLIFVNKDRHLLKTMASFLIFISFISLISMRYNDERLIGIFTNSNELGLFSVIALIFTTTLVKEKKKVVLYSSILLLIIIMTGSRTSMLSAGLVLIFNRKIPTSIKLIGVIVVIALFSLLNLSFSRLPDASFLTSRGLEWGMALYAITEYPIFGSGLASYDGHSRKLLQIYSTFEIYSAHNGYLSLAIMLGIPLALSIILVLAYPFLSILFSPKKHSNDLILISFLGTLVFFFSGLTESVFTGINALTSNLLWFLYIFLNYSIRYRLYSNNF